MSLQAVRAHVDLDLAVAKIKEAQLREKPERRAWEVAPSFFKWTCGNYIPVREARALDDFEEKLRRANAFRHHGNDLAAKSQLEDALMQYIPAYVLTNKFDELLHKAAVDSLVSHESNRTQVLTWNFCVSLVPTPGRTVRGRG